MPEPDKYDEHDLLRRLAQGEEAAFRALFDRYRARFYAAALKMTRSAYLAEEVVQEVFVVLWSRRQLFAAVENPSTYLFTIVYNSIYAHFRRLAREQLFLEDIPDHEETADHHPEKKLHEKETHAVLQQAIGLLPEQQRNVYRLIREEGLSREEAARELGISPHTVKNHLGEAMKFIRNHIEKTLPFLIACLIHTPR